MRKRRDTAAELPLRRSEDDAEERGLHDVFVSYSRRDHEFVDRLVEKLERHGRRIWVDRERIPPTALWLDELKAGIEGSDVFLFVISPASLSSDTCSIELSHAVATHKRVAAIVRRPVDRSGVPGAIAERQWISFEEDDEFGPGLEALLEILDTDPEASRIHTRLLVAALEWERRSGGRHGLLRGPDLIEALAFATRPAGRKPQPVAVQRAYIEASRAAARRRRRLAGGTVLVLASVAAVLVAIAIRQSGRADEERSTARSREFAAHATDQLQVDPERALALAVAAYDARPTEQARAALTSATLVSSTVAILRAGPSPMTDATFAPDGRHVVTGSADGRSAVWDWKGDRRPVVLPTHAGPVWSVDLDPASGRRVLTTSTDGLRVADARTGTTLLQVQRAAWSAPNTAAFSPDGRWVAGAYADQVVRILDSRTGKLRRRLGSLGSVDTIAFSPDGALLAAGGTDGTMRVWIWKTRRRPFVVHNAFDGRVAHVEFLPNNRVVLASGDGRILLWDPVTNRRATVTNKAQDFGTGPGIGLRGLPVVGTSFSRDVVAAPLKDDPLSIGLWYLDSGRRANVLPSFKAPHAALAFSPDGRYVLSAGADGTARVLDHRVGQQLLGATSSPGAVVFSADGRLVVAGDDSGGLDAWIPATGEHRVRGETSQPVAAVALTSNGAVRAALTTGEVVEAPADGADPVRLFDAGSRLVADADMSGNGRRAAFLSAETGGVTVWYEERRRGPPTVLEDDEAPPRDLAVSPDGRRLATTAGGAGSIAVWRLDGSPRAVRIQVPGGAPGVIAFTGDCEHVFGQVGDALMVWNIRTRARVAVLRTDGRARTLGASSDGRFVAAADGQGLTRIWEWRTGARLAQLDRSRGLVDAIAFSPDSRQIATAHDTRVVQVTDCPVCTSPDDLLRAARGRVRQLRVQAGWAIKGRADEDPRRP